jgi:hypothetical protein
MHEVPSWENIARSGSDGLHFMLGWLIFVLLIQHLHVVRNRQIFSFVWSDCVHRVRSGHVFRSDWSLILHKMRSRVVFDRLFIEQLHAVHRGRHVFSIDWSLNVLNLQVMFGWLVFLPWCKQLHVVHLWQVFSFVGFECVHRVRRRKVLSRCWSKCSVYMPDVPRTRRTVRFR